MLITETYKQLNQQLHNTRPDYGTSGKKWASVVKSLAEAMKTTDVLDYGCGKQTLRAELPYVIGYDPCIPGLDDKPSRADLVVCTDVLEHIEPDCLDEVMNDLVRVTGSALIATVATRKAVKFLADGRNAHLIVEQLDWWLPRFWHRFQIQTVQNFGEEFLVIANAIPS